MGEQFLLGLLGHRFQLVDQDLSMEFAEDSFPESVARFCDLFCFLAVGKAGPESRSS